MTSQSSSDKLVVTPANPLRRALSRVLKPATSPATETRPKPKKTLTAVLRQWHQRVGLGAALFILWLGVSGTVLSRSNELGFDTARIRWPWLTSLYGLHAEAPRMGFEAAGHWMAATKESTLLDALEVTPRLPPPVGMVSLILAGETRLFIATHDSLVISKPDGERVDELRSPVLPISSIRRVGVTTANAVAIQDFEAYQSTDGGNTWEPVPPKNVVWSQPSPLPAAERTKIEQFAKPSVLVEQVLIDLHTGRLFGAIGSWVITIVGFLALWLSVSGVWSWWRISQSRKRAAKGA